ncbi:hypothetical protein HYX14_02465 [Candidatus Woesearchaeota archaeon]|nr:hypothetical protein [Candidatus Woesearchaeota archaeon]
MNNAIFKIVLGTVIFLFLISCTKPTTEELLKMDLRGQGGVAMHIHPQLEIEILGEKYEIPENIGITPAGLRVIHIHGEPGVLHVESPVVHQFFLKDFFTVWGRKFDSQCIFDNCVDEKHKLKVYVNGVEDFHYGDIPLEDNEKIKIVYQEK